MARQQIIFLMASSADIPFCDPIPVFLTALEKLVMITDTYYFFQLRTADFKAYCAIWVKRSNFSHQASPRVSPRESTQRRKVELWAKNVW